MNLNPRSALAIAAVLAAGANSWAPTLLRPAPKHRDTKHRANKSAKKVRKAQRIARRKSRS